MPSHFVSLADFSTEQLRKLLEIAHDVKRNPRAYRDACEGQTLAMIFQKPSLRLLLLAAVFGLLHYIVLPHGALPH